MAGRDGKELQVALVGLGNPIRRDDGLGPVIVSRVAAAGLPPGSILAGTDAVRADLLQLFIDFAGIVIVDALIGDRPPGTITRCTPDDLAAAPGRFPSFHHAGLPGILSLARAAGGRPEVVIVGIEPADTEWGGGLSRAVERAVERAVPRVRTEIVRMLDAVRTHARPPTCPSARPPTSPSARPPTSPSARPTV